MLLFVHIFNYQRSTKGTHGLRDSRGHGYEMDDNLRICTVNLLSMNIWSKQDFKRIFNVFKIGITNSTGRHTMGLR